MFPYVTGIILICCSVTAWGQSTVIQDGFEDGNFTQSPAWEGDLHEFTVSDGEPNHLLQLQGSPTGGTSHLSTASTGVTGSWEFYYRYDATSAPSASNKATVFLTSDRADLEGAVSGYAVQVGRTGDDTFELVRYDSGVASAPFLTDTTQILHNDTGYRVRVTRSGGGQWQLEVGTGYSGRLFSAGTTIVDNTYTTSTYFGVLVTYTSTRADRFYFDFKIDLPPFTVRDVTAIDNQTLAVSFNREFDASGISPGIFSLDKGAGSPATITIKSPDQLQLHYDRPLPSAAYLLSVSGLSDLLGNAIQSSSHRFILFGAHAEGDVIINEFLYDPPPGGVEYIEIYNTSNKYLDLSGWEIGDAIATASFGSEEIILEASSFLVLTADTSSLYQEFGPHSYLQLNLPTLNNTGDGIRLFAPGDITIDSLSYTASWGGRGVALERRSFFHPAYYEENWGDAPNGAGTPGEPNEIPADEVPPSLKEISMTDSRSLRLIFSERLLENSAIESDHYQITPTINISSVSLSQDTVHLVLAEPLGSGLTYNLSISDISDLFGNISPPITQDFKYMEYGIPQAADVVINEIFYTSAGEDAAEFVELFNNEPVNFDLSNWHLKDANTSVSIPSGVILEAKDYLILTGSPTFANNHNQAILLSGFPSLNDDGDIVHLSDAQGFTIDSLRYSNSWSSSLSRSSLERKDPKAASNDRSNWQSSGASTGHTAGSQNTAYQTDVTPPRLLFSKIQPPGFIEAQFNEFIRLTTETRFMAGNNPLTVEHFDSTNADRVRLKYPGAKPNHSVISLTAENLTDIKGNHTPATEVAIAHPLVPATIVINEIMFRPLSNPDDNRPDQSEYLELRNTTDRALSLEGLVLHDAPDERGNVRSIKPVTSVSKWIPSQGTALIYPDTGAAFSNSRIANFFDLEHSPEQSILHVDRASLSLASNDDAIYIADSTGATIDSVYYEESWHNPNLYDTRGISLERISPTGDSNNASNWGSSVMARGGTPYQENSIYQSHEPPPQNDGLHFVPNPFSPDGDGFEDHLFVHYQLDEPDYLIKAEVYDRYGRYISTLADGLPAGFEGTLMWDGRREDGGGNNVGIYVIVFEAYDSASGKNKAFKEAVVLARRFN